MLNFNLFSFNLEFIGIGRLTLSQFSYLRYGSKFLICLIEVDKLMQKLKYDRNREHQNSNKEHPGSIQGAPREVGGSIAKIDTLSYKNSQLDAIQSKSAKNALLGAISK